MLDTSALPAALVDNHAWHAVARPFLATPAELYARALEDAPTLNLGGQLHGYLIALTCAHHGCPLVTADRRQADLARPLFEDLGQQLTLIDLPGVPESRDPG